MPVFMDSRDLRASYEKRGLDLSDLDKAIRLADIEYHRVSAGPGARVEVFFQGCTRRCDGCINAHITNWNGGRTFTVWEILGFLDPVVNKAYYMGAVNITIGGGEPFDQLDGLAALMRCLRALDDGTWHILIYSGYTHDQLWAGQTNLGKDEKSKRKVIKEILAQTNVLIDGPFELMAVEPKTNTSFIGSSNQRYLILDNKGKISKNISASEANGKVGDYSKEHLWEAEGIAGRK